MRFLLAAILLVALIATADAARQPAKGGRAKPADGGPDLPWSCATVRFWANALTPAQLEALRIRYGRPPLTPKQRRQAIACINGTSR